MFNIFKKQQQKTVTNDAILSLKYTPSQDVEELATIILASTNTCVVHHSQKIKIQKNLKSLSIISNGGSNRGLPGQTSKYVVDYEWADETTTSIQVALLDLAKFYRKHKVKTVFAFDTDHFAVLKAKINRNKNMEFPDIEYLSSEILLGGAKLVRGSTIQELYDARFPNHPFQILSPLDDCIAQYKIARSIYNEGRVVIQVGCSKIPSFEKIIQGEFKNCDLDGNGKISREEFREWYSSQWEKSFEAADANGDGSIDYEEFKNWYAQHEVKTSNDYNNHGLIRP